MAVHCCRQIREGQEDAPSPLRTMRSRSDRVQLFCDFRERRTAEESSRLVREGWRPLDTFDLAAVPELNIRLFRELAGDGFIKEHRNVIFLGGSGRGKTPMSTALGIEACRNNFRTRFVTCYGLVNELIEARQERTLQRLLQKYDNGKIR